MVLAIHVVVDVYAGVRIFHWTTAHPATHIKRKLSPSRQLHIYVDVMEAKRYDKSGI